MIPEPPNDVERLCSDLGIGLKRRAKLATKHGDQLVPYLQGLWAWARRQDTDRWPARQNGLLFPPQYTQSEIGAVEDIGVSVPDDYQRSLSIEGRARFASLREAEHRRMNVEQLSAKLRSLHKRAEKTGADLTEELAAVSRALEEAEAKLAA